MDAIFGIYVDRPLARRARIGSDDGRGSGPLRLVAAGALLGRRTNLARGRRRAVDSRRDEHHAAPHCTGKRSELGASDATHAVV